MQTLNLEQVYREYEDYMLLKNYSKATLNTYLYNLRLYHRWCILSIPEQTEPPIPEQTEPPIPEQTEPVIPEQTEPL